MRFIILVFAALLAVNPVHAQDRATRIIPAKTPLTLAFTSEVSSKTAQKDSEILFVLAEDLVIDGQIIVPKGAKALGEVIHVQKSGFGGKGGELILAARYLEFNGRRIRLRSLKPYAGAYVGKNNSNSVAAVTTATAVAMPVLGFAAVFITGGEINIPVGTLALAMIAEDTAIDPAPPADNAFSNPPKRDL